MSIRLYNTLLQPARPLPEPQGQCVCTSAARPSMRGPTSGTRARSSSRMWLRNWLRERGYDATLVHNITDINDKIYEGRPGRGAELAEQVTAWYLEDTAGFGLGIDHLPKASEMVPRIVRFIEQLIEQEYAYAVEGDVYFRVAKDQRTDGCQGSGPTRSRSRSRTAQGGRAGLRALEGKQARGGHFVGLALGSRPAGLAHRVLGHGRGGSAPVRYSRSTAEGSISSSRTTRTNWPSRCALGHEFARIWTHSRMLQFTDEKMSKSLGNVVTIDEALEAGPETLLLMFLGAHWRKPMDFSEEDAATGCRPGRRLPRGLRNPSEPARGRRMGPVRGCARRRLQHPEALAIMHGWRDHELVRRGLGLFGLGALAETQKRRPRWSTSPAPAAGARGPRLRRGGSPPRRDRVRGLDRPRRRRRLPARPEVTTEQVYGRNAVREALRGPRGCGSSGPPSALSPRSLG